GAFVAGLVLNGSPLGHNAAERSLPLRDAFAVLFFVSVGMLFDPTVLIREPLAVLAVLAIVVLGKSIAALAITFTFKLERGAGLTIAASLAQVGEFSFILAGLGVSLNALSKETHDLILAAALLSISLNPFVFALADRLGGKPTPPPPKQAAPGVA
ncbi:MAG: potassium transporter Kef, partial [Phenylobacterium zucineum]